MAKKLAALSTLSVAKAWEGGISLSLPCFPSLDPTSLLSVSASKMIMFRCFSSLIATAALIVLLFCLMISCNSSGFGLTNFAFESSETSSAYSSSCLTSTSSGFEDRSARSIGWASMKANTFSTSSVSCSSPKPARTYCNDSLVSNKSSRSSPSKISCSLIWSTVLNLFSFSFNLSRLRCPVN